MPPKRVNADPEVGAGIFCRSEASTRPPERMARAVKTAAYVDGEDSGGCQSPQSDLPHVACHAVEINPTSQPSWSRVRVRLRRRRKWMLWAVAAFVINRFSLARLTFAAAGTEAAASCVDDSTETCSAVPPPNLQADSVEVEAPLCGLYVAESTVPGAGIGLFSGVEHQVGSPLGYGDVCIPIIDLHTHWKADGKYNPFAEYEWAEWSLGMDFESALGDTTAICPGINCMVNGHLGLLNLGQAMPTIDDATARERRTDLRRTDPGTGSYTRYHNGTNSAKMHIPAGSEIFERYGDEWFITRTHLFPPNFPVSTDYPIASNLLTEFLTKFDPDYSNDPLEGDSTVFTDAQLHAVYEELILTFREAPFHSRVISALPPTWADVQHVVSKTAEHRLEQYAADPIHFDVTVLQQRNAIRDIKWLNKHGRCLDYIRPKRSSLPYAARGAFATRNITANVTITTSPLLHFVDGLQLMTMYEMEKSIDPEDGSLIWTRNPSKISGYQLVMNYGFAHRDTSLFLFPYGSGVPYINHNPDPARVNVGIRWAEGFSTHNHTLVVNGTISDLALYRKPVLALDYVALRDISQDEELFMDYGPEWQLAWERHERLYRKRWSSTESDVGADALSGTYVSAAYANMRYKTTPLRTVSEQELDPYPENLDLRCHPGLVHEEFEMDLQWRDGLTGYECNIVGRSRPTPQGERYTVEIGVPHEGEIHGYRLEGVGRDGFSFFDRSYTTDIHLPYAFRFPMMLPDHLLPPRWRNIKVDGGSPATPVRDSASV
jgi:hypothetical protein